MHKTWQPKSWPQGVDHSQCDRIAEEFNLPAEIASLLLMRGLRDSQQIDEFLNPSLSHLPSPFAMSGMERAVTILEECIKTNRPVGIYGDYDVDGITGSAVLYLFLKELGLKVSSYQPDRLHEGYGLHEKGILQLHESLQRQAGKAGVLITVDCGITGIRGVEVAKKLGITVIVTDHHRPTAHLPAADTILNPRQPGCLFPDKNLAGVGVAFYLAMGLRNRLHEHEFWHMSSPPNLKRYLDLVALGTVADQVELKGVNRILVKAGLEVMNQKAAAYDFRPGMRHLLKNTKITGREITVDDFAFRIAPRINAAGRIGKPDKAMALLTTLDTIEGERMATDLEEANRHRRGLEQALLAETIERAEQDVQQGRHSLVLEGNGWHPGVIGIVATRLMEHFFRPTVLLSFTDDMGTGSARSIPGLHLFDSLTALSDVLERYGGHAMAAGMTIHRSKLEEFKERFEARAIDQLADEALIPKIVFDSTTDLSQLVDATFLQCYERLSPFGNGNPEPVFVCRGVRMTQPKIVGGSHLRFKVSVDAHHALAGIGFGFAHLIKDGLTGTEVDMAVRLRINEFWSSKEWELNLVDLHPIQTTPS